VRLAGSAVVHGMGVAETRPDEFLGGSRAPEDARRAGAGGGDQMYVLLMREPNDARAAAEAMAPGVRAFSTQLPVPPYLT
jgi:hypothetical protein